MPQVWTTCMKSKLDFNGSDKYEARHEGEFWRWLIDVKGPNENFISLFTSLMQLVLLQHMCNFYWTQYVLTITMTRMFFRPYKSEPADLSSPWASKTPSLLTATYCSRDPAQENFWLIDVTALFVNLLFRCLAFSAVALRCVSTPVGGIILSQTTALLLFVAGSS